MATASAISSATEPGLPTLLTPLTNNVLSGMRYWNANVFISHPQIQSIDFWLFPDAANPPGPHMSPLFAHPVMAGDMAMLSSHLSRDSSCLL